MAEKSKGVIVKLESLCYFFSSHTPYMAFNLDNGLEVRKVGCVKGRNLVVGENNEGRIEIFCGGCASNVYGLKEIFPRD